MPDLTESMSVMSRLDAAWPKPSPEEEQECLRVLEKHGALDVAEMLGLAS